MKVFVMYNTYEKVKFINYEHRVTTLKHKKCSFKCNTKLKNNYENENDEEK